MTDSKITLRTTNKSIETLQVTTDAGVVERQVVAIGDASNPDGIALVAGGRLAVNAEDLPLPTGAATAALQAAGNTLVGAVNEAAPGTDTASSGLNGRLQRIAQRLTSLIALLPASIGQKAKAASMSVTMASDQDPIAVETDIPRSAFGDHLTAKLKGIVAIKATYGILRNAESFTASGGSATTSHGNFVLQTGTTVGGYAVVWSRMPVVYEPGVGVEARGTFGCGSPVANSLQMWGLFTAIDGMFVGYNGTQFGVMHRHGGEIEVRTLTVGTAAGGAETVTVTLNGVAYTAGVTAGTKTHNAHEIATALTAGAAGALWKFQHIGETVVCVYRGAGEKAGTFSVASTGVLAGSFARDTAGAAPAEDWTYTADWDGDDMSWFNPASGAHLYKVEFGYLGYGPLNWYVRNPNTDKFVLIHQVDWGSGQTEPNFRNPSMRPGWVAASMGSTTNLTVYGANTAAFLQGEGFDGRPFGASGSKASIGTTSTLILSVQVRNEFGGRACNAVLLPTLLTLSTDSTNGAVFRLYRGATINGDTAHAYVDEADSIAIYDSAGTTLASAGQKLPPISVGPQGRTTVDLSSLGVVLSAGDELSIFAEKPAAGAGATMTASLGWEEVV